MTGSDDGGFKPHPGDPWHPGWVDDVEQVPDDEAASPGGGEHDEATASGARGKKKRKKKSRRDRRRSASADEPDPAFDPSSTAFDRLDEVADAADETVDEDPFGAVLEREGESHRSGDVDDVPPPAWTVDVEPSDDPVLPVEQPSWVGQTTVAGAGVEAVGFEATIEPDDLEPSGPSERSGPSEPEESPAEVIGTYGVAGPEAFDALAADDTGELDDWEAYLGAPEPGSEGAAPPGRGVAVPSDEIGSQVEEPELKRRRGLFKRGKELVDSSEGHVEPEASDAEAIPPQPRFSPPTEPLLGEEAFGEWIESDDQPKRGLFRRRRRESAPIAEAEALDTGEAEVLDPAGVEALDGGEDELSEVVAEVLEALGDDEIDDGVEQTAPAEAEGWASPPAGGVAAFDERMVPPAAPGTTEYDSVVDGAEMEVEAEDEWLGEASGIPDEWFAEVDEDVVVPPPVVDTPETEWAEPVVESGADPEAAGPIFDIEAAERPAPLEPAPAPAAQIPEGYEPWHAAVEEAVGAAAAAGPVDDGTYEYEQPVLQDSRVQPDDLPAGFEPFPGDMEQFELSEESLRSELAPSAFEEGWVTDDVDPGPTGELPYGVSEEMIIDEEIYAVGATIEHRDLAAAIADAGVEDTQWQAISAAMPGLETGVVGFADVADLGTGGDYVAPTRSNLGVRIATGLVLVGLLFGSLVIADAAFTIFVGLLVMLGLGEFYSALRRSGYLPLSLFGLVGGLATMAAVWFHGPVAISAGILLTSMATFFFYAFSPTRRDALANAGLTVLGVGWIIGGIAFAVPIARAPDRVELVFAIVAVTAAADIGAFSFGRAWGRSPLAPVLSPNKTVEGLVGGIILALAAAGAIGFFELGPFDLRSALGLGVVVALLAPLGDLSESLVKRAVGIKDMGGMLPGHGGILDRIDAFLFVVPAAWVLFQTIGFLG